MVFQKTCGDNIEHYYIFISLCSLTTSYLISNVMVPVLYIQFSNEKYFI